MKKQMATKIVPRLGGLALILGLSSAITSCLEQAAVNNAFAGYKAPPSYHGANANRDYSGRAGQRSAGGGTYDETGYGGTTADGEYTDDLDYTEEENSGNSLSYHGANANQDYSGRAGQRSAGGGTYDETGYGGTTADGQYTDDLDYTEDEYN